MLYLILTVAMHIMYFLDMNLLQLLVLISLRYWPTAIASQIFYVLPDSSSYVSCPTQPCATLGQYLLDNNGTLPVVSNVEYHFLSGEHHLPAELELKNLSHFTVTGRVHKGSLSTVLVSSCYRSNHFLLIKYSHHVNIVNIVFKLCEVSSSISYFFLSFCTSLMLENIFFLECGLKTYNIVGCFAANNVTVKQYHQLFQLSEAGYSIIIEYDDMFWNKNNRVKIINISIIIASYMKGISFLLQQMTYNVKVTVNNMKVHKIQKSAV